MVCEVKKFKIVFKYAFKLCAIEKMERLNDFSLTIYEHVSFIHVCVCRLVLACVSPKFFCILIMRSN